MKRILRINFLNTHDITKLSNDHEHVIVDKKHYEDLLTWLERNPEIIEYINEGKNLVYIDGHLVPINPHSRLNLY